MILGESGAGKSSSMRNFRPGEIGIFNVASKPLPFKSKLQRINNATYASIAKGLTAPTLKRYVIDDAQYLLSFELFDRVKEKGYEKFTEMAVKFKNLIHFVITRVPDNVIVYFMQHVQHGDYGIKAKTVGRMLDDQLTVEGLFSVVLLADHENGRYFFRTQTNDNDTVKSPMGMFDSAEIDNDLVLVDTAIRDYWEIDGKVVRENNT